MKSSETSHGGAEVTLSTEEAGEVIGANLGHVVCFSPPTAQALELVCEAGKFQARSELYPALRFNSSQILSERLPMLEERSHELATQPVAPRLARTLVRLLEQNQNGTQKPVPIGLLMRNWRRCR